MKIQAIGHSFLFVCWSNLIVDQTLVKRLELVKNRTQGIVLFVLLPIILMCYLKILVSVDH